MTVIVNAVIVVFLIAWFVRFGYQSGIGHGEEKIKFLLAEKREYISEKVDKQELMKIFVLALLLRVAVYVASFVMLGIFSEETSLSFGTFLEAWNKWDSPHYINLAKEGYAGYTENGQHIFLVFFPLFPWLLRLVHLVIRDWQIAALVLSSCAYAVGACFFYLLLSGEYGKSIAKKALVLISVYPFAFFFGGIMTESLFFCTMSAGFYFIRKHNWAATGLIGLLCSLCRVQGILLLGVAGVEFFVYYKPFKMLKEKEAVRLLKLIFTKAVFLLLIPVGNIIYFFLNYKVEGDFFRFSVYQKEHWYHTTTYFTNSLSEIYENLVADSTQNTMRFCIWFPEIILFVLSVVLLIYALRRHPLKYTAYLFVYTMVNYSVTFLISGGRYMLCAFPMFIIMGEILDRHPKIYNLVVVFSSMLCGIYMAGFLSWKQIL